MADGTRWVLTFLDDGRGILTTDRAIERETYEHVLESWKKFVSTDDQLMVIGNCRVERVGRVELDIRDDQIIVRNHDRAA